MSNVTDVITLSDDDDASTSHVSSHPKPVSSTKRSAIWAYFSENPDVNKKDWVRCDLCLPDIKEVKTKDSSTSNLKTHLLHNHPSAHAELVSKVCQKSAEASPASSKKRRVDSAQPTLKEAISRLTKYPTDSAKHKAITTKITVLLVKQMLPPLLVESQEWIDLLQELNSQYVCPSRKQFSDTEIPSLYTKVKSVVMNDLKSASGLSCTTDGWSSVTSDPFLSLTVHFLTPSYQLRSYCLRTIYLPESHTGENIVAMIRSILSEYDLHVNDVTTFTTDNGSNMKAAMRVLAVTRIPCFGHVLHNAVNNSIKDEPQINSMIKECRTIVSTMHHSFKWVINLRVLKKALQMA